MKSGLGLIEASFAFDLLGDDSGTTCQRCLKAGQECVRHPRRVKFRHGSTAKYDSEFSRDQIWVNPSANGRVPVSPLLS